MNGKLYVVSGDGAAGGSIQSAEVYDPAANGWSALPSPPTSRAYASAAAIDGKLYVTGGCVGSDCRIGVTGALDVFDGTSWTSKAAMPTPRYNAVIGGIGGKLYVAGGMTACPPCIRTNAVEVYDPAADQWSALPPFVGPRDVAGSAVLNERLLAIGGSDGGTLSRVDALDPLLGTWSSRAALPAPQSALGAAAVNGRIFAVGGSDAAGNLTGSAELYDPVADAWSALEPLPTPRYGPVAVAIDGGVYVLGAEAGNTASARLDAYTCCIPESDQAFCARIGTSCGPLTAVDNCGQARTVARCSGVWLSRAAMPTQRAPAVGAIGNTVYAVSGYTGSSQSSVNEAYDAAANSWGSATAHLQTSSPAVGVVNGKLYLAGGTDNSTHVAWLYVFDPTAGSSGTWTQLPSMPGGARSQLAGGVIGNVFYAVGGYPCSNTDCARLEGWDTVNNAWLSGLPSMPTARADLAVATVNGKLYALGGFASGVPVKAAEVYDPAIGWTSIAQLPVARGAMNALASGGKIYLFGGTDGASTRADVLVYDPSSNTWSTTLAMPTPRQSAGVAPVSGGIDVVGGCVTGGSCLTTNELYCP